MFPHYVIDSISREGAMDRDNAVYFPGVLSGMSHCAKLEMLHELVRLFQVFSLI